MILSHCPPVKDFLKTVAECRLMKMLSATSHYVFSITQIKSDLIKILDQLFYFLYDDETAFYFIQSITRKNEGTLQADDPKSS